MSLKSRLRYRESAPLKHIPLEEYLNEWAGDARLNANIAGRLIRAIGKPTIIDTSKDPRLGRVFSNRTIREFDCFKDRLFGIEDSLDQIVRFFEFAAQFLEQEKRILYMKGPPGSGKSTIAKILMELAQKEPVWVLGVLDEKNVPHPSPLFESPLGLFDPLEHGKQFEAEFKIPKSRLGRHMSQWALAQLAKLDGDLDKFVAVEVWPSLATRTCVARHESTGMETVDFGRLIGIADEGGNIDKYDWSGALNRTTQGLLEYVEMFREHTDAFIPLLSATSDREYSGDGNIGVLPYEGMIIAHSNPAEFQEFSRLTSSLGLLDRVTVVQVPYCTRMTDEALIYKRYLDASDFKDIPCVPHVLDLAAAFAVGTRVDSYEKTPRDLRIRLYDGQPLRDLPENKWHLRADDLRREADLREGMNGIRTRFILDMLPTAITKDAAEPGLDPVSLFEALDDQITLVKPKISAESTEDGDDDQLPTPADILKSVVVPRLQRKVSDDVRRAYVENIRELSLAKLNLYIDYADPYGDGRDYKDPETGDVHGEKWLEEKLQAMEKGVRPDREGKKERDDFRKALVTTVMRFASKGGDRPPWEALDDHVWRAFEQHNVLPKRDDKDMLLIISFAKKETAELEKKHADFMTRLCARGYTARQARRTVEWYLKNLKDM